MNNSIHSVAEIYARICTSRQSRNAGKSTMYKIMNKAYTYEVAKRWYD